MSFDEEVAHYIQRYLQEVKGESFTITEILSRPRWKRIYMWHKALHHYEGRPMSFTVDEYKSIYGDDRG